jgi:DNA primase
MNLVEHLKSRHLDLELHRPVLSDTEGVATFYLWNLSGQLVGYQQYRPLGEKKPQNNPKEGKYFTYRKQPTLAVWGVESLKYPGSVFVCEGVFDACRLTEKGCAAVAVLSNNIGWDLKNWLSTLNRRVVAVCDNDSAGKKLAKFGHEAVFTADKDLGDSSEDYVNSLVLHYA